MKIQFEKTQFMQSCPHYHHLPTDNMTEIAFAGRSNAGKSTLINKLCNQNGLAKTSGVPGKTREMNLFNLFEGKEIVARLVDLPGYGYAKTSLKLQTQWQNELGNYLLERPNLKILLVIMDSRFPLTELDQLTLNLAAKRNLRQILVFNKVDKLNQSEKHGLKQAMQEATNWPNVVTLQHSSLKRLGTDELKALISKELSAQAS